MSPRPAIFISAVSSELRSARQLVANTLTFLGYEPEWQDIFGTEEGDLRAMLRRRIDSCKGVVQLVGKCYGAEPSIIDEEFGRISYTQYEALYAIRKGKKVWYLFLDESFPTDPHAEEDQVGIRKLGSRLNKQHLNCWLLLVKRRDLIMPPIFPPAFHCVNHHFPKLLTVLA
jgi:Domain of unknown function (DUF4062)